jgi:hypothetical protein
MESNLISEIKWRFITAIAVSLLVIILAAFEWSIIDRITPFLYMPLAGVVWVFFIIAAIAGLTCVFRYRKIGVISFSPLSIMTAAFLIVYFVPFTNLWLKADFALYKKEREEIVKKVYANELKPNVSHNPSLIDLGNSYPLVSMGGNEIVVEEHAGLKYVFFYTFRGILDNYSGFIYVPDGGEPKYYSDLDESNSTQITPLDGNWYYASHH